MDFSHGIDHIDSHLPSAEILTLHGSYQGLHDVWDIRLDVLLNGQNQGNQGFQQLSPAFD